jgi:hypothetical protein
MSLWAVETVDRSGIFSPLKAGKEREFVTTWTRAAKNTDTNLRGANPKIDNNLR